MDTSEKETFSDIFAHYFIDAQKKGEAEALLDAITKAYIEGMKYGIKAAQEAQQED